MSSQKRRKSLLKRKRPPEDFSLQITSMADVFVILLVFLLKSFSSEAAPFTPDPGIQLPEVSSLKPVMNTLGIEILKGSIKFDHHEVIALNQFKYKPEDLAQDGSLHTLRKSLLGIQEKDPELRKKTPLMILADREAPVDLVKKVLATASLSGFETYKLIVAEDN